jgi:hypothetical protein
MNINVHFWSYLVLLLLKIENFQEKSCTENQNTYFMISIYIFNRAFYEIMWKHIILPDKPQKTMWRMRIACWIPKATQTHTHTTHTNTHTNTHTHKHTHTHTHTHTYILLFHCNNVCTNAPQFHFIRTLPVLFKNSFKNSKQGCSLRLPRLRIFSPFWQRFRAVTVCGFRAARAKLTRRCALNFLNYCGFFIFYVYTLKIPPRAAQYNLASRRHYAKDSDHIKDIIRAW